MQIELSLGVASPGGRWTLVTFLRAHWLSMRLVGKPFTCRNSRPFDLTK